MTKRPNFIVRNHSWRVAMMQAFPVEATLCCSYAHSSPVILGPVEAVRGKQAAYVCRGLCKMLAALNVTSISTIAQHADFIQGMHRLLEQANCVKGSHNLSLANVHTYKFQ